MPERIMLKAVAAEDHIILRTITSNGEKSAHFFTLRNELAQLREKDYIVVKDYSLAEFACDRSTDKLLVKFYWMDYNGLDCFKGYIQRLTISCSDFMDFISNGLTEFKALSVKEASEPKITFFSNHNLHEIVKNKLLRRKFSKFLRDNFKWASSEIKLYDDFVPYSFVFREFHYGRDGMCGGLVLHGQQEDMSKAYYSIHT